MYGVMLLLTVKLVEKLVTELNSFDNVFYFQTPNGDTFTKKDLYSGKAEGGLSELTVNYMAWK